jgi:hypothetical protein
VPQHSTGSNVLLLTEASPSTGRALRHAAVEGRHCLPADAAPWPQRSASRILSQSETSSISRMSLSQCEISHITWHQDRNFRHSPSVVLYFSVVLHLHSRPRGHSMSRACAVQERMTPCKYIDIWLQSTVRQLYFLTMARVGRNMSQEF